MLGKFLFKRILASFEKNIRVFSTENKEQELQDKFTRLHTLIEKGNDFKENIEWQNISTESRMEISKNRLFSLSAQKQNEYMRLFNENKENISEINVFMRKLISKAKSDVKIINLAKEILVNSMKNKDFIGQNALLFKNISVLDVNKKNIDFIKEIEPIFAMNLEKMNSMETIELINALKSYNYTSEPIFSTLIKKGLENPKTLGINCLTYLSYVLWQQNIHNRIFFSHVCKFTIKELQNLINEKPAKIYTEFPAVSAIMFLNCMTKEMLIKHKECIIVEECIEKYLDLVTDIRTLCSIFSAHSNLVKYIVKNVKVAQRKVSPAQFKKYSDDFYHKLLNKILAFKSDAKISDIMTLMASAPVGRISKKQNGIFMLQLADHGFKLINQEEEKIKSENSKNMSEKLDKLGIIKANLHIYAKKYAGSGKKNSYYKEIREKYNLAETQ